MRKVHETQEVIELNDLNQVRVYVHETDLLREKINTTKKRMEILVQGNKETEPIQK
jgi:hypothetical protein